MSLLYNNYQRLQQENADEIAKLSAESWNTLSEMMTYASTLPVSLFELEVIKKDLIGTAIEAQVEGVSFRDKIGVPEKEFCDSLVMSKTENDNLGRILLLLKRMALWGLLSYLPDLVLGGAKYEVTAGDIVFVLFLVGITDTFLVYAGSKTVYTEKKKKKGVRIAAWLIWAVVFVFFIVSIFNKIVLFSVNSWAGFAVLLFLAAAAFFGNNYYWDKCSEKYNWR